MPRVCIIGLDCLTPQLLFGPLWSRLPNFRAIADGGLCGPLRSCLPPITIPAWAVMFTGVDPGTLGLYGFRDRADWSYDRRRMASSLCLTALPLWSHLTRAGRRARIIGVPPTYPAQPLRGALVTGMMTPPESRGAFYPADIAAEVERISGGYLFDVPEFRNRPARAVLDDIYLMTERRFRLAADWVQRNDWDLLVVVEMGPDRMHHRFWPPRTAASASQDLDGPGLREIADYYLSLDAHLGAVRARLRPDDILWVVSDHGAQANCGGFAINDWLIEHDFLCLHEAAREPTPLTPDRVDWSRTRAWAEGGYVGRIYFNVAGREPTGTVPASQIDTLAATITEQLLAYQTPIPQHAAHQVFRPRDQYRQLNGHPPDLIVALADLAVRAQGRVGHSDLFCRENDTGPDGANHAWHGVLLLGDGRGQRELPFAPTLLDVAPTVLHQLGLASHTALSGRIIQ